MKKQECSQLFVAIVPFLCAFLFAFWLWRYLRQPEPDTDRLTVAITYTNYNFNTITPLPEMECAIDKNFSKRLRQMSSRSDLDLGTEEYAYQIDTIPKVIYITPPDLYLLSQPYSAEISCTTGNTANYNGDPWFTIRAVSTEKISAGVFDIKVTLDAFQDVVPFMTSLKIDGIILKEIRDDPDKIMEFDNFHYTTETLLFRYNRHAREDISDLLSQAVLRIDNISYRISNASITASCNIPDINIVIVPTDGPSAE